MVSSGIAVQRVTGLGARLVHWRRLCVYTILGAAVGLAGCGNTATSSPKYSQRGTSTSGSGAGTYKGGAQPARPGEAASGSQLVESSFLVGIRVAPADLSGARFGGDWTRLAQWVSSHGWNNITAYAVEPSGSSQQPASFYFDDVAFSDGSKLSDHGFTKGTSLSGLLTAAQSLRLTVNLDISRLALSRKDNGVTPEPLPGDELTKDQIADICTALCRLEGVDRIIGQWFPDDWATAANAACQAERKQFLSGDGLGADTLALRSSTGLMLFPRSIDELTWAALSCAAAAQVERPAWVGVSFGRKTEAGSPWASQWPSLDAALSALQYLTVVAKPTGFVFDVPIDALEGTSSELVKNLRQYAQAPDEGRKSCNVILVGQPPKERPDLSAAVNAITSAGYALTVSREPRAEAAAYYIIAFPGTRDGKPIDIPDSVARLLGDQTRRVVVQVAGQFPSAGQAATPGWDALRRHCALSNDDFPAIEKPIAEGLMDGKPIPWGGKARSGAWGSRIRPAALGTGASATVTAKQDTDEILLMIVREQGQGGAVVLVNGAQLSLPAAAPISTVLARGGGLQAPTSALVTVSDAISAFLATDGAAEVSVKIGGPDATVTSKRLAAGKVDVVQSQKALASVDTKRGPLPKAGPRSSPGNTLPSPAIP